MHVTLGGDWAGWENVGAIFACSSRERQIMHNRTRLLAQAIYEIEAYDLTPSEAKVEYAVLFSVATVLSPFSAHAEVLSLRMFSSLCVIIYTGCAPTDERG